MTTNGRYSLDNCIENHLKAWTASRIYGDDPCMVFYGEDVNAIKLIDKIAKEYFE